MQNSCTCLTWVAGCIRRLYNIYIYIYIRTHIHIHCTVTQIIYIYTYIHIIIYAHDSCACVCVIRYWCTDAYSLPQRTVYNYISCSTWISTWISICGNMGQPMGHLSPSFSKPLSSQPVTAKGNRHGNRTGGPQLRSVHHVGSCCDDMKITQEGAQPRLKTQRLRYT